MPGSNAHAEEDREWGLTRFELGNPEAAVSQCPQPLLKRITFRSIADIRF